MRVVPNNQIANTDHGFFGLIRQFNSFQAINGGLDLGDSTQTNPAQYTGNLNGQWANITAPGTPDTEFSVTHELGKVPSFYWVNADRACSVYQLPDTGTAWTETTIFLKCSVASAKLRIFIL